jgi:glycosyltransferase involved in cell wall biosynthesis
MTQTRAARWRNARESVVPDAERQFEIAKSARVASGRVSEGVAPSARPIVYDMTHLIARLRAQTGTGIDRIDLAFGRRFGEGAARYDSGGPRLVGADWGRRFTEAAERVWTCERPRRAAGLWAWLEGESGAPCPRVAPPSRLDADAWRRRLLSWTGHVVGRARVPERAIYLNVGYHRFEDTRYFAWLSKRADVDAVFMIHDLLPLDYPEYFAPGEGERFRARIATALRYGNAFLVSTRAVERRLEAEIAARGLPPRPIWAAPFPSPLAQFTPPAVARRPQAPYFVVVGTIEPRKNHLLLLHLWRDWARQEQKPPRLVVVGGRGWENGQILALLDRSTALEPYVAEISDLGSADLARLIGGARALLAPSFEEGYGLPVVEALALGVPVVAADSPVAREVGQGRARLLPPLDGPGWRREIEMLTQDAAYYEAQRTRARGFAAPNWPDYFASLHEFLERL